MATTNHKKEITVAVRIPKVLRAFFENLANKERRTLSQVLRIALEDYEARAKKKAA